jgi:CRP-like cAMP-binding protein
MPPDDASSVGDPRLDRSEAGAPRDEARAPEDTGICVRRTFERAFRPGEIVFDEGDPGAVLYVIQSGEVELTRQGPNGPRLVARLGAGEFFGEMSVVLGGPRSVRARVVSEARLLELDGGTLQGMCLERPEIAIRMIRRLAVRLIELEGRLSALGVDDLLRPVVRALVRRAEPQSEGVRIGATLRQLAGDAGLSLLEAHRALQQLLDRKLVRLVDDTLLAPDLEALSACLDAAD